MNTPHFPVRACLLAFSFALSLFLPRAGAAEPASHELPAEQIVSGQKLVLNGSALRTVWGFEIYRIGLFLANPSRDENAIMNTDRNPKRVHIIMIRGVSKERFSGTVQESIDQNFSPEEKERFNVELATFLAFFHEGSDLKPGSEVILDYVPGQGMVAFLDGTRLGTIPGEEFYHAILRLWIATPLQKSIKDGLLGLGD
ncbi:MAG: chalcone isomerase family protein [Chthoniobacterales bacterium]